MNLGLASLAMCHCHLFASCAVRRARSEGPSKTVGKSLFLAQAKGLLRHSGHREQTALGNCILQHKPAPATNISIGLAKHTEPHIIIFRITRNTKHGFQEFKSPGIGLKEQRTDWGSQAICDFHIPTSRLAPGWLGNSSATQL